MRSMAAISSSVVDLRSRVHEELSVWSCEELACDARASRKQRRLARSADDIRRPECM
jgi:hypothetical protein